MSHGIRKRAESNIYHVMSRGNGKQIIFEDNFDRERYLAILREMLTTCYVELLAWCLMDNHVHLLLHAPMEQISQMMQMLNSRYAIYFNKRYERVGHLLQGPFRSEAVATDAYFMTVVSYIHRNPQEAAMAPYADYRWSSYKAFICDTNLPSNAYVLDVFGGLERFIEFHKRENPDCPCIDIDKAVRRINYEDSLKHAKEILHPLQLEAINSLDRKRRNEALCALKEAQFSLREIERFTGISRCTIARAK